MLIFERARVSIRGTSNGRAQVATVGTDEPKSAGAEREDFELPGVVSHVVSFTQQHKVVEVGAAAVKPVDAVVGMQALGIRAARMAAMTVLAHE